MARRAGKAAVDPDARQVRCHPFGPRPSSASYPRQALLQHLAIRVDIEPDNVNCFGAPCDGDLDSGNQVNAMHDGCLACFGNATRYIVVGERKNSDAVLRSFMQQAGRAQ